jgi:hypothetical protein
MEATHSKDNYMPRIRVKKGQACRDSDRRTVICKGVGSLAYHNWLQREW